MFSFRFRWWHAALVMLAANVVSAVPAGLAGDAIFYNTFRQPVIAPPAWSFPPVWLFLNVTSAIALYRIANAAHSLDRSCFIVSELVGWVLFAVFPTVFFLLKSPVLGALDTVVGLAVAIFSCSMALRIDRLSAAMVGLRCLWLGLASYVSVWIARNNPDVLLNLN